MTGQDVTVPRQDVTVSGQDVIVQVQNSTVQGQDVSACDQQGIRT